ncbi:MAG: AraC family transcriptional regulator [Ruminococcus sp.]|nr:AraC family transcriptional regulator [Ruminococcus sp.]
MYDFKEIQNDYAFHFLNDIKTPVIQVTAIGRQTRINKDYYWNNKNRRECYLFQYTLNGSVTVEINNQKYIVDKGKCFFIKMPSDTKYYFDEEKNVAPYKFIYVIFNCNMAKEYCDYIENHLGNVFSVPFYNSSIQLLFNIHTEARNNSISSPFMLSSKIFEFLCTLCTYSVNREQKELSVVHKAKEYFDKNYSNHIGISDATIYLKISQSHLSREFYKQFGEKPVEYLTRLRLKNAIDLLTSTSLTIEDISTQSGFSSSNYFNKVFKKHMNMTPNQFRIYVKQEGYSSVQI